MYTSILVYHQLVNVFLYICIIVYKYSFRRYFKRVPARRQRCKCFVAFCSLLQLQITARSLSSRFRVNFFNKIQEGVNFLLKKFTPLLLNPILQKFLFRQPAPVLHAQNLLNQLRGFWLFFIQNISFLYFFHRGFYLFTVISVYGGQHISAGCLIAHFLM